AALRFFLYHAISSGSTTQCGGSGHTFSVSPCAGDLCLREHLLQDPHGELAPDDRGDAQRALDVFGHAVNARQQQSLQVIWNLDGVDFLTRNPALSLFEDRAAVY